ncbi:murein hydrolase activator EnvC family protein [Helicobacter cappadocius]|uniref:Peptidoglycan DD-metalloendopeptidase family protein n=1 Tax=Helicobacter cappadocius TaxID=3063998 RepID=A0AA90PTP0_9HELI|nr:MULTISPECIES: peptidoglycan DD-metalloendopeptidase family protein [unclassified Helicobacter]MDO7253382.1 peptidoglycan DD-metalloendopeptidase family protein [Helicobacter sp. faydin-H75]MDP2539354.1 peptidoglycan DD-metalloendopeptidase family protein [Helicobacter sp. faydin-H76]
MNLRIVFLTLFVSIFLFGAGIDDIDKNIDANKSKLQKKDKEKIQISNILNTLGNTINQKHNQIKQLNTQIQNVQKNINKNQSENSTQEKALNSYKKSLQEFEKKKKSIEDSISNILIKDMAFIMVLNHQSPISPDDIILQEIFKSLNKDSKQKIEELTKQQESINLQISQITSNMNKISVFINNQKDKKQKLQSMILEQKKLMANLKSELDSYDKKLRDIDNERKSLDNILSNLNILKQTKEKELLAKKAKEEAQKQQAKAKSNPVDSNQLIAPIDVKQVANSYQSISTTKYKGPKTISPISSYKVEQKFGPYFDPVYKLKVFNESVTLLSNVKNALVRNIFDGKVVYAKEVPILKKVVIIEHANQMHTIYSQLDKIAPTIKPGLRIKKGYVIGRVDSRLGFEVTQKDKHIDPMEIILPSK